VARLAGLPVARAFALMVGLIIGLFVVILRQS